MWNIVNNQRITGNSSPQNCNIMEIAKCGFQLNEQLSSAHLYPTHCNYLPTKMGLPLLIQCENQVSEKGCPRQEGRRWLTIERENGRFGYSEVVITSILLISLELNQYHGRALLIPPQVTFSLKFQCQLYISCISLFNTQYPQYWGNKKDFLQMVRWQGVNLGSNHNKS